MAETTHANLVEYYFRYKDLILLHQKLKFGKAPRSSEGFTEAICCSLFNLQKASGVKREYDLIDPVSKTKFEVKGTTETYGATTINPNSVFDYLIWITFLFPQDTLSIKKIPYSEFKTFFESCRPKKRANITLSTFNAMDQSLFYVSRKTQEIVPHTLEEQLLHICKNVR